MPYHPVVPFQTYCTFVTESLPYFTPCLPLFYFLLLLPLLLLTFPQSMIFTDLQMSISHSHSFFPFSFHFTQTFEETFKNSGSFLFRFRLLFTPSALVSTTVLYVLIPALSSISIVTCTPFHFIRNVRKKKLSTFSYS